MYAIATAPRGIGQVLDSVFYLTRRAYLRMLPYTILSTLVSVAPYLYALVTGAFDSPERIVTFGETAGYWIAILVMVPVTMFLYGAGIVRIESIAQGQDMGFGASMRRGFVRLGALLVSLLCCMLVIAVGVVLLVVPGLILTFLLMMFVPAVVIDGKGPIEALRHSRTLVWGNWWRVATISVVASIIMYVLFMIAGILVGYLAAANGGDPAFVFLFEFAVTAASGLLMTVFFYALLAELYREVKMRKTGIDISARIALVGTPS